MNWTEEATHFVIRATFFQAAQYEGDSDFTLHARLAIARDPANAAFALDLYNPIGFGPGYPGFYSATWDESTNRCTAYFRVGELDSTPAGSYWYEARTASDNTFDLGTICNESGSTSRNYGYADAQGAIFVEEYGSTEEIHYFDAAGKDFLDADTSQATWTYRMSAMSQYPDSLTWAPGMYTPAAFIDLNENNVNDIGDLIVTEAELRQVHPLSSQNSEPYIPLNAADNGIDTLYLSIAEGDPLPTYNGTTFVFSPELAAIQNHLDSARNSRADAYITSIEDFSEVAVVAHLDESFNSLADYPVMP